MRYIEVTHTYVIPVPAEDEDVIEPLAREGMGIMEGFMRDRAANIKRIRSDWKLLPREYVPEGEYGTITPALQMRRADIDRIADREEAKYAIENDLDRGVSFAGDVMGQDVKPPHPWDQGLRVLPLDHPYAEGETQALRAEGLLCGTLNHDQHTICFGVRGHEAHGVSHLWVAMTAEEKGEITHGTTTD